MEFDEILLQCCFIFVIICFHFVTNSFKKKLFASTIQLQAKKSKFEGRIGFQPDFWCFLLQTIGSQNKNPKKDYLF